MAGRPPPQHQDHRPGHESEAATRPESEGRPRRGSDKLRGKVAIISGGNSGLGRAVAFAFAREGADIAVLCRHEDEDAAETRNRLEDEGRRGLIIAGDAGDPSSCGAAVRGAVDAFGRLDILVNIAAGPHPRDAIEGLPLGQIERTFRADIFSQLFMTRAALPHLGRGAVIVNTTPAAGCKDNAMQAGRPPSKEATVSFTRALARSVAGRGIRVNAVAPGSLGTSPIPSIFPPGESEASDEGGPMGRRDRLEEVAACFVFLASGDSSCISGQVLHPTGGEVVNG